jgi:uncharacterized protein YfkK (UPF0435 family)
MNNINIYTIFLSLILISSCKENITDKEASNNKTSEPELLETTNKVQILNFGTFHMGFTNDANTTEFDEHNKDNQKKIHDIAERLSNFKPTVIIVETVPEYDKQLQTEYNNYLDDPNMLFKNPSEIELLAYELGRLSKTKRIFGIDHKMGYNYNIGNEIENSIDSVWHDKYYEDPLSYYPEVNINEDSLNLLEKLKLTNHDMYLDFLITVNADMLTFVGTEKGFEGADEATKYYQRNLRMFSNLNRIQLTEDDRVFILMGASHTAFFRDFISRSPKYEMVNTIEYLK